MGGRVVLYEPEGDVPLTGQRASSGSIPVSVAFDQVPFGVMVSGSVPLTASVGSGSVVGLLVGGVPLSTDNPVPVSGTISISGSIIISGSSQVTGSVKLTEPVVAFLVSGGLGVVSTGNSTAATLAAYASFTGSAEEVKDFATISVFLRTNVTSSVDGFKAEYSSDGTNWDDVDNYTIPADTGKFFTFTPEARYFRIRYQNGGVAQSSFRMQTIYHLVRPKPSSHRIDELLTDQNDAELVKAVITGKVGFGSVSGSYINAAFDDQGRLVTAPAGAASTDRGFANGNVVTAATLVAAVRATAYNEPSSNAQRSISSNQSGDAFVSGAAKEVLITYLDSNGVGPKFETIALSGGLTKNTVNTDICFIERMDVTLVGASGSNTGSITLFASTNGTGGTVGSIGLGNVDPLKGDNETLWTHHYVPSGSTCFITGISVSHNGTTVGSGAIFFLRAKRIGVANAVDDLVSDVERLYGQSSTFTRNYGTPLEVEGPARITMYVLPETTTSTRYRGAFDFYEEAT